MCIVSNLFSSYRLSRAAEKKNLPRLMKKARSEQLLLQTYVKAPTPTDGTQSSNVEVVSAHILGAVVLGMHTGRLQRNDAYVRL